MPFTNLLPLGSKFTLLEYSVKIDLESLNFFPFPNNAEASLVESTGETFQDQEFCLLQHLELLQCSAPVCNGDSSTQWPSAFAPTPQFCSRVPPTLAMLLVPPVLNSCSAQQFTQQPDIFSWYPSWTDFVAVNPCWTSFWWRAFLTVLSVIKAKWCSDLSPDAETKHCREKSWNTKPNISKSHLAAFNK